jgi:hypothetical protein
MKNKNILSFNGVMAGFGFSLNTAASNGYDYPNKGWMIIIGVGFLLGFLCLFFALRNNRKKRFIENLPTSKSTGVFIGLVEIKGKTESKNPLKSLLSEKPCVYYSYRVEEQWKRSKVESYRDKDGKLKTRVKTETGWEQISGHKEISKFYVKDDYGVIRVDPNKAKIKAKKSFQKTATIGDPLYFTKGPADSVDGSLGRRRFTEEMIGLNEDIYVIGQARERKDKVEPEIAFDKEAPIFVVSTQPEKKMSRGYRAAFWVLTFLGGLLSVGGWAIKDLSYDISLKQDLQSFLLIIAVYFSLWAIGWIWMVYNDMIRLRNFVRQGWSNVDVQMARRHDLISNLIDVVKGYKEHEKDIQETLSLLRNQSAVTGAGSGEVRLRGVGANLLALREAYPELKAQSSFLKLQKELSDTETRIALARSYYNDIATSYNTRLQTIPDGIIGKMGFLKKVSLIEAEDFERPSIKIELVSEARVDEAG